MKLRLPLMVSTLVLTSVLSSCGGGGGGGDDDKDDTPAAAPAIGTPTTVGGGTTGPALGTGTPTTPGSSPSTGTNNPSTLLGLWVRCDAVNELEGNIRSLRLELEITNETKANLRYYGFTDSACQQKFTRDNATALLGEIEASGTPPDELSQFEQLLFGLSDGLENPMEYRAAPMNAQGVGTMDQVDANGERSYTSYKIVGKQLFVANTCIQSDIDNGDCNQLKGESTRNRATDFTGVLPFTWGHD